MEREVKWGPEPGLIRMWKVQPGASVLEGDILAIVEPNSYQLLSPVCGTLLQCHVRNNTKVVAEYVANHGNWSSAGRAARNDFELPFVVLTSRRLCFPPSANSYAPFPPAPTRC